jgi:hypothetical protein
VEEMEQQMLAEHDDNAMSDSDLNAELSGGDGFMDHLDETIGALEKETAKAMDESNPGKQSIRDINIKDASKNRSSWFGRSN